MIPCSKQVKRKLAESQATLRQNLVWLSASLEVPSPCAAKLEEAVEIMRSCFDQVRTSKEVDELLQEYAAKDDEHHHKQEVSTDGLPTSTDEPMETCKVFENVKIADSEEDGEDPGNQDLEQMLLTCAPGPCLVSI